MEIRSNLYLLPASQRCAMRGISHSESHLHGKQLVIATYTSKLCLFCESPLVENAVRLALPDSELSVFPIAGSLTSENVLSETGSRATEAARNSDAVLIEWVFEHAPVLNTLSFHTRRAAAAPVFMLTRGQGEDRVAAIAAGADDAFSFPLDARLLSAKVMSYRRLVRAAQDAERGALVGAPSDSSHDVVSFGPLRLDRTSHRFFIHETEIELTPREHALIDYLIRHSDELCTRDSILDNVWGINFDTGTNMVDVYMYFLRKKLEGHGLSAMIETIRGRGYRLVLPS